MTCSVRASIMILITKKASPSLLTHPWALPLGSPVHLAPPPQQFTLVPPLASQIQKKITPGDQDGISSILMFSKYATSLCLFRFLHSEHWCVDIYWGMGT